MTQVYRDGKVHVWAQECAHCLYGPDRIVSGRQARQITADIRSQAGAAFICHRSQVSDDPEAVCRGWYDRFAMEDPVFRLARVAGVIEEVGA